MVPKAYYPLLLQTFKNIKTILNWRVGNIGYLVHEP